MPSLAQAVFIVPQETPRDDPVEVNAVCIDVISVGDGFRDLGAVGLRVDELRRIEHGHHECARGVGILPDEFGGICSSVSRLGASASTMITSANAAWIECSSTCSQANNPTTSNPASSRLAFNHAARSLASSMIRIRFNSSLLALSKQFRSAISEPYSY
jgi:hypothetical protein